MKTSFKSIYSVAKTIFSKLAEAIVIPNFFTSVLNKKAWEIYRDLKAVYVKKGTWVGNLRNGLFSDAIKVARQVLTFERLGMVQFKKVGDDTTIHTRNIVMGYLEFNSIGGGLYRFIDELVLEANGGDLKGAIRSFKLENIHLS